MSFGNIPEGLRVRIQWCCWKLEPTTTGKPTKVPYNPLTGKHASATDPQTWVSFEQAVQALWNHPGVYAGIGYFFSERDPFCGVDLDDPFGLKPDGSPLHKDPAAVKARQEKIFRELNSYSELSPSGKGLHIIVEAAVPSGRRRDSVEVYSSARFFTMTGNVIHNVPIAERQDVINVLWEQMGTTSQQAATYLGDLYEHSSDAEIIKRASEASNGDLFKKLWNGDWSDYASNADGTGSSEADFALIDIIAFYTQNKLQIERLFLQSALGKREKYLKATPKRRATLIGYMINKSFDLLVPPVDLDAIVNQINEASARVLPQSLPMAATTERDGSGSLPARAAVLTGLPPASPSPAPASAPAPDPTETWLRVPPGGIIGAIQDYILRSSPLPVYEIALVGALGLFAGIVGRQYTVSGTGLNQYLMLVTETGKGKEAISGGIGRIIDALVRNNTKVAADIRGPGAIASGQALLKYLASRSPCCVSLLGEFGLRLRQITSDTASSADQTLRMVLLDLYNKSGPGNSIMPSVYADKANNTDVINSPAFSLIGESTGERFYEALDETNVREGLVPRFTIIEYNGPRVDFNYDHVNAILPEQLLTVLKALIVHIGDQANQGVVISINVEPEANEMMRQLERYVQSVINSDKSPLMKDVWNRVSQKVYRLAGLLAVSDNYMIPTITARHVEWARSLIVRDTNRILAKFERGEMGANNNEQKQLEYVKQAIKKYIQTPFHAQPKYGATVEMHSNGVFNYQFMQRRSVAAAPFRNDKFGAGAAIIRTLKVLVDMGVLQEVPANQMQSRFKHNGRGYAISDPAWFLAG